MIEQLEALCRKHDDMALKLADPNVISDLKQFKKLNQEYKELDQIVHKIKEYKKVLQDIAGAEQILQQESDKEFLDLAKYELDCARALETTLAEDIRLLMIPKDPEDQKNCVMELRAGTGGDEASIFAGNLFEMYSRFCEKKGICFRLWIPAQVPWAAIKKLFLKLKETGHMAFLNLKAVFIAFNVYLQPKLRAACILQRHLLLYYLKLKNLM